MLYKPLRRNISLLYLGSFLSGCMFFYPILALYLKQELFTVFNVTLLYSIITVGSAVLEIPTGILSDFLGRKNVYVLARIMDFCAILFLAFGTRFYHFVFYALCVALLSALSSGNDDALAYDTLDELGEEHLYKKVSGRIAMLSAIAVGGASMIGAFLAHDSYRIPVFLALIPSALNILVSLFLCEPSKTDRGERSVGTHLRDVAGYFLRGQSFLLLACAALLSSFIVEPIYQLLQIFYQENGIPVAWFGFVYAVGMAFRSAGAASSHALSSRMGEKGVLLLVTACTCTLTLLATYLGGWMAVFFLCIGSAGLGIAYPIWDHMLHREIQTEHRATVLSTFNLATCIGLTALVPLAGFLSDHAGIRMTYRLFGVFYILLFILLTCIKQKRN